MNKTHNTLLRLLYAAVCLALAYVLPFLTANNPQLGNVLCLMHIPVLLCGILCGWPYGLAVGFCAPLLRSLTIGMPPMPLVAVPMAFELAAYGLAAGLCYRLLPKKFGWLYVTLPVAMLFGRIVFGVAKYLVMMANGNAYTFTAFLTAAFVTAVPGMLLQLVLIPPLVLALKKAGLVPNGA